MPTNSDPGECPCADGNRPPLRPTPLIKLPVGAVTPRGWLRRQLELQAAGFVGRLGEISPWLRKEGNAWLSPDGVGHSNWEELPYWLKGFGDMAYLLGDEQLIAEAGVWIDGILAGQRADGYFGPRANLEVIQTDDGRKPDLWPNMVVLNALQSYYEWTEWRESDIGDRGSEVARGGNPRVIAFMQRYFRWQLDFPEADFLLPFWQQQRAADNLASVYWLYNRTGEAWLLDLAHKIHRHTANWTDGVANWHGVNIAQSFRGPAVYWQQSGDERLLAAVERNYRTVMDEYGQVPGGMFAADENCRRNMTDPRQAAEACTMVEFMYSFEQLLAITGDPLWADRCEEVAFNSLPASMTADLRALRYLTSPNQVRSDARSKAPGLENGGPMQLFDPREHRCCQHNIAHGWPYFCEHLWMATADRGLAAVLHAPGEVRARVGDGEFVHIVSDTRYPFRDKIEYTLHAPRPAAFPLYLRIPGWCEEPELSLNGRPQPADARGLPERVPVAAAPADARHRPRYICIDRTWSDGERLLLRLPMRPRLHSWRRNHDSVSIAHGPLWFSLQIGERYVNIRPGDPWPAFELEPTTPWNYGLCAARDDESPPLTVRERPWPADDQPFVTDAAPLEFTTTGRRIPEWQEDHLGLVGLLQPGPARTDEPLEALRLVPMGGARLRISAFPRATAASDGRTWSPPPRPADAAPASASHCYREDTLTALSDGLEPASSDDFNVPRFTWWDRRGSVEWVQYDFPRARRVARVAVYWFDDSGRGRCRTPASWRLLYKPIGAEGGAEWRPVRNPTAFGTLKDTYNEVAFEPVETTALRIEAQLRPDFSGGILEWRVE